MIDRALLYVHAFKLLAQIDLTYKTLSTDDEWERITRIHRLLGPFCNITCTFFGSKYPTLNIYALKMCRRLILERAIRL